jgi:hypothetical protein
MVFAQYPEISTFDQAINVELTGTYLLMDFGMINVLIKFLNEINTLNGFCVGSELWHGRCNNISRTNEQTNNSGIDQTRCETMERFFDN